MLALTPLMMSSPAFGITKAEYETLLAEAQQKVDAAQAELEQQQQDLVALNNSKAATETSLGDAQKALEDAQASLNVAIEANNTQSQRVAEAQEKLANAQALVEQKQSALEEISQDILLQSSQVTIASQELDEATQNMDKAFTDMMNSEESLNSLTLQKQQSEEDYSVAVNEYNVALLNYNLSVGTVHEKGTNVDSTSVAYNQSLANLQTKLNNLTQAQAAVDTAQYNYNNNLIAVYPPNAQPTIAGLRADIYREISSPNPIRSDTAYTFCKTITVTEINKDWGGGNIEGCGADYVMIHYRGYLTVPTTDNYEFLAMVDDGWHMTIGGTVVNDNWTLKGCGGNWSNPMPLQAGQSYAIDAWMFEWGGGACNILYYYTDRGWGVVPASWLSQNQPTQPTYEYDPALLSILQQKQALLLNAQQEYDVAMTASTVANDNYVDAIDEYDAAIEDWQSKQDILEQKEQNKIDKNGTVLTLDSLLVVAQSVLETLQTEYAQKQLEVAQKQLQLTTEQSELNELKDSLDNMVAIIEDSTTIVNQLQDTLDAEAVVKEQTQLTVEEQEIAVSNNTQLTNTIRLELQAVEQKVFVQQQAVTAKYELLQKVKEELKKIPVYKEPVIEPTPEPTEPPKPTPTPEPEPTPEPTGDPNIPKVIEDLTKVDLEAVVATNLTEAQVEQLTEAAMETFETAEQGSPEYEQALDALFVVAQADDIVISEELAAIPGAVALVDAINFIGNVGADMSPKVREESEKIVVTAVVAVGAAVNAATGAALTAAAPASGGAPTGGSSGGTLRRRI
jgi:hypothetical protein